MEDCLLVTYDQSSADIPTLVVYRNSGDKSSVVSQFQDDMAFAIYCLLTDMGILRCDETIKEVLFQLKCVKEHLKFIYQTTEKSIDFDIQVLDTCISLLEDTVVKSKKICEV